MGSQRRRKPSDTAKNSDSLTENDWVTQREAYLSTISHLRSRLLSAFDAMDTMQSNHDAELRSRKQELEVLRRKLAVYKSSLNEANAERQEMKEAVQELVLKVEKCNDYSLWPYSRIRITNYADALPMPASTSQNGMNDAERLAYAAAQITALQRALATERTAHNETKRHFTARVSSLEAQLAFREAELESDVLKSSGCPKCRKDAVSLPAIHHESPDSHSSTRMDPDATLRVLNAARAKSRSLEQDIKDIAAKLERTRTKSLPTALSSLDTNAINAVSVSACEPVRNSLLNNDTEHALPPTALLSQEISILGRPDTDHLRSPHFQANIAHGGQLTVVEVVSGDAGRDQLDFVSSNVDEDATARPMVPSPKFSSNAESATHAPPQTEPIRDQGIGMVEEFGKEVAELGRNIDTLEVERGTLKSHLQMAHEPSHPLVEAQRPFWTAHGRDVQTDPDDRNTIISSPGELITMDETTHLAHLAEDSSRDNPHHATQLKAQHLLDIDDGEISMDLATPLNPTTSLQSFEATRSRSCSRSMNHSTESPWLDPPSIPLPASTSPSPEMSPLPLSPFLRSSPSLRRSSPSSPIEIEDELVPVAEGYLWRVENELRDVRARLEAGDQARVVLQEEVEYLVEQAGLSNVHQRIQ